ncbi:hypothetical protein SDC9_130888 [bioreactor metagenome]|uniref:Uncharacterized protein n=1 Tax=bioreactor metagenome TaxID=1076179 RepID=A0A645D3P5_9ZZZZ
MVAVLLQINEYGDTPPETLRFIAPLLFPHTSSVITALDARLPEVESTTASPETEQPLKSVTVYEYVPPESPVRSSVAAALLQRNDNGAVPPETVRFIAPFD